MSITENGKIGGTYREKSRWIGVKNAGEYEIPAFAPCCFAFGDGYRDETQPLVVGFYGQGTANNDTGLAAYFGQGSTCMNGPTPIPPKRNGYVTLDFPAVARVKHFTRNQENPDQPLDQYDQVFVDLRSAPAGLAVAYLSDVGDEYFEYRQFDEVFYRNTLQAFKAVAPADEAKDLFWIVPSRRNSRVDFRTSEFEGSTDSQEVIAELPLDTLNTPQDWAKLDETDIVINLPGVYVLTVKLSVAEGELLSAVDSTLPTDYALTLETESLSDQLEKFSFGIDGGTCVIRQPSHLYRIHCEGYDVCPTMDIVRPAVSEDRVMVLRVSVTDKWKQPTYDGKTKAIPLLKLKASRAVNFDVSADVPELTARIIVNRFSFAEFYIRGFMGSGLGSGGRFFAGDLNLYV